MFNAISSIALLTDLSSQQLLLIGGIIVILIIVIVWLLSSGKEKEVPPTVTEKPVKPKTTAEEKPESKVEAKEKKEREIPEETEKEKSRSEVVDTFQELTGIGKAYAEGLYDSDFTSLETIAKGNIEDLTKVEGIGESTAEQIKEEAKQKIQE